MSMYDDLFGQFNQPVAQILLTRNDLADVNISSIYHNQTNKTNILSLHFLSVLNI